MKSRFITLLLLALTASTVHALIALIGADTAIERLAWAGSLLATGSFMGFFAWLMRGKAARTSAELRTILVLTGIGAGITLYAALRGGPLLPLLYALVIGLDGCIAYVYWYSRFADRDRNTLAVGNSLPSFTLKTADGKLIDSASLVGKVTLLLFYRGNWCPLCMAQIQEIAGRYRELAQRGVQVLLVSPQSQKHTQDLSARFDAPMQFLIDEDNAAAKTLGIDAPNSLPLGLGAMGYDSDTVLPTVLLIDRSGHIAWNHLTDNYRVRPEPDTFIAVIDRLGLAPAQ
ncbi:MAG: peroxiredoxin family protein [Xanthomonadaceae bacterium]|nr:peroxiredoxin family protein [Xanthomonadaceae bacterium]